MENYDLIKVIWSTGRIPGELSQAFWSASPLCWDKGGFLSSGCREGHIRMLRPGLGVHHKLLPQLYEVKSKGRDVQPCHCFCFSMQDTMGGVAGLQPHEAHLMTFDFRQTYLCIWRFSFSEKLLLNVSKHLWVIIGWAFLPPWITEKN